MPLPDIQKKILRNWGKLFTGATVGAALGLLATIIMTRAIGITDVGIVSVIQTFWRTLEGFLSFQSFQVLIKNGTDILHGQSGGSFRALVKICMIADCVMALFGALIGIGGIIAFHSSMNIPSFVVPFGVLGAMTMMTMVTGAHLGILRLFNRYNVVAGRDVLVGALRVILNGAAFLSGTSLITFVCIWVITEAAGNILIVYSGFRELRVQGYAGVLSVSLHEDPTIKVWSIVKALCTVNFTTMLRVLSEEGDTLLVNQFAGPAAAGKYKIAKNFASILYKFTGPLEQSVYPEIAKAVSERNRAQFKSIMLHTNMQCGLLAIAALIGWSVLGDLLIHLTVGDAYKDCLETILIITGGYAIGFFGIGFGPALYAFGKLKQYLVSSVVCTFMYFAVAIPLLPVIGLNGSAYGQVACYVSGLLVSGFIVYRSYCSHRWS